MTESPVIRSVANTRIKAAVKLRRGRVGRDQGLMVIDGLREASRAIDAKVEITSAFYCAEDPTTDSTASEVAALLRRLPPTAEQIAVSKPVMEKLAYGERHAGLVLVAKRPEHNLQDFKLSPQPLVVVLENVEKPGNLGAVLRTADAVAADAVVLCGDQSVDPYHANVIRASSGVVFGSQIAHATVAETLAWLANLQLHIVTTLPLAEQVYTSVDYRSGTAIVLGSEAEGLTRAWEIPSATPVKLPMLGIADSLNVSTAAAVILFEALRQRGG